MLERYLVYKGSLVEIVGRKIATGVGAIQSTRKLTPVDVRIAHSAFDALAYARARAMREIDKRGKRILVQSVGTSTLIGLRVFAT